MKTLWSRFILCFLISTVFIFFLLNTYGVRLLEQRLEQEQVSRLTKEAKSIEFEYRGNLLDETLTFDHLAAKFIPLSTHLDIRVWIVNREGQVLIDSYAPVNPPSIDVNQSDPHFLYGPQVVSKKTFPGITGREPMLCYINPVSFNFQLRGYIVLLYPYKNISAQALVYYDVINLCFLIIFPLLFLIFLYFYRITSLPMKHLIHAAREYSTGNYKYPLKLTGLNEFHELGNSISYMASELNNLDEYQKKFVANISHDFRSPLTSIKGYAEAIVDGTIPHEMQNKYLNIILFETERLNKLTSGLLELNRFESKGTFLDISTFDINTIIKRTAESFEGICREKKITLNLIFSASETYVDADISKIQQVLYNLIDNAVKFSHSNSQIRVSVEEKNEKVLISIKDNGIGIPRDSLKKIWDRFYKTDSSRGKDKKGTGLGLSITKEIIQAHNENITVTSTEDVGSEFVFSLSKHKDV